MARIICIKHPRAEMDEFNRCKECLAQHGNDPMLYQILGAIRATYDQTRHVAEYCRPLDK